MCSSFFQLFVNTCLLRLTLMVTVETVMCVLMPFLFRQYCTKRTTWFFLLITLSLSTLLHSTLVFTTEIAMHPLAITEHALEKENSTCWYIQNMYMFMIRSNSAYDVIQKIYYWIQTTFAIIIPTIAMLVCSILIVKQFTFKELGEAFSQRRKCVIRMTVATTVSHLLLEGPATLTHAAVALKHHYMMCVLNNAINILSIVNATIPFFVFLLCNEQFRHMTAMYLRAHMQTDSARKKTYLSQAGMRCSQVSRMETERSFIERRLHPNSSNL
uniref:G_PROTEIN_RECEP_F1_2 domain-containing protein n=1 Tax=Angiostrongylus cantonensis TaxID=6313 RepID=A0A0K0DPB6_ANGCA